MLDDIFYLYNIKTFANNNIIDYIKIKIYTKMKFFICVKERHIYKNENIIIICKFDYEYLFNLIVLYMIIISSQITFQILIISFDLIICFKIKCRE